MTNVQFAVDDPKIASIDEEGYITGKNPGTMQLAIRNYFQEGSWSRWGPGVCQGRCRQFMGLAWLSISEEQRHHSAELWSCLPSVHYKERFCQVNGEALRKCVRHAAYSRDSALPGYEECRHRQGVHQWAHERNLQDEVHAIRQHYTPAGCNAAYECTCAVVGADRTERLRPAGREAGVCRWCLIASWAKENVYKAVSLSLMSGADGQTFNPDGVLTYEQTFVLLNNLFEKFADAGAWGRRIRYDT